MTIGSKWSYIVCGINFMVAVVGAMFHNTFLLIVGSIFTFFNYYTAEINRSIEDEQLKRSITETKA